MQSKRIYRVSALRSGMFFLALFAAHAVWADVNELTNGGFEDETGEPGSSTLGLDRYGAWSSPAPGSCSGSTEILTLPYPNGYGQASMAAYEGDRALNLGPCFGRGSIRQSFTTIVGTSYEVSLALRDGQVKVSVFNEHMTDLSADAGVPVDRAWTIYSFRFTASGVNSTIVLQNASLTSGNCCAPVVDDIRVIRMSTAPDVRAGL